MTRAAVITRVAIAATLLSAAALLLDGCSKPEPVAEERLLVIDGIEIRLADVEPYVAFLDSFRPDGGRKTKVMMVVREHLLPLRFAQRAFPEERAEKLEQANALRSVADNFYELERRSELIEHKRRSTVTRMKAQLPVSMFLFDELNLGAASQPIEVPQGWFLVGTDNMTKGAVALGDHVDALQVGFVTHTSGQWAKWWQDEKQRIADKATFVHPDYRDSLPGWIQPPKKL